MKKIINFFILVLIFNLIFCNFYSYADDFLEEINEADIVETATETLTKEPEIFSDYALVLDRKTLSVLYEKDAYEKTAMASTTKIMTCIVALENSNLTDIVTVSKKASQTTGSCLGLREGDKISVNDLLYALMLRSGNDCAIAISEYISGSVEDFAILMNEKAKELNLENTNFVTPHGLDDDNHYTTAYELAIITDYALKNKVFKEIVSTKQSTIYINSVPMSISNTNELLGNVTGVYGVKTGFTFKAGRCLVTACKRDNLDIIIVVLGADTKKIRTLDSKKLINYIFTNYEFVNTENLIKESFENYKEYFENNVVLEKTTDTPIIEFSTPSNFEYPLKKSNIYSLNTKIYTLQKFSYKIEPGTKIGYISLYEGNSLVYSLDITFSNTLSPNDFWYYFKNIFNDYKSIFSY